MSPAALGNPIAPSQICVGDDFQPGLRGRAGWVWEEATKAPGDMSAAWQPGGQPTRRVGRTSRPEQRASGFAHVPRTGLCPVLLLDFATPLTRCSELADCNDADFPCLRLPTRSAKKRWLAVLRSEETLDSVVGHCRVGCDAVRWQGAPTQWADAHQEKQRSQRAVVRLNRLRSVLTQWVKAGGRRNLSRHEASEAVGSGQLPNLGYRRRRRRRRGT